VDLNPVSDGVVRADGLEYLRTTTDMYETIESYNLLEHLPDPGQFLKLCYSRLEEGGRLLVVTDNAEWLPFYLPVFHAFGFGAHHSNEYHYMLKSRGAVPTVHYMVFSPLNLRNLLSYAGFRRIEIRRITFGARLKAVAWR
jgi:hypothetical protein